MTSAPITSTTATASVAQARSSGVFLGPGQVTAATVGRVRTFIDVLCEAAPNTMRTLSAGIVDNDLNSSYQSIQSPLTNAS